MCAIEYYTYDDYLLWEGDWELICGYPLMMSPSVKPDVVLLCNEPRFRK